MKEYNCCLCLCVYNNEFGLPYVLNNILKIQQVFNELKILVFYDVSNDKSLEILNKFNETHNNMEIIINNKKKSDSRVENIAFARNNLLQTIKNKYDVYKYFIMMDSNEYSCIGDVDITVLEYVLNRENEWDAISFDREAGYYDLWALSLEPYIYSYRHFQELNEMSIFMSTKNISINFKNDIDTEQFELLCKHLIKLGEFLKNGKNVKLDNVGLSSIERNVNNIRKNLNEKLEYYKLNKPNDFIPAYSAFNGFSIYKTKQFINCSYDSNINLDLFPSDILKHNVHLVGLRLSNNLKNDCEHRKFHLEAIKKNNAKIRICSNSLFSKFKNPPENDRGPC